MHYAALLRGINVGGVTVKMDELKRLLEGAGFLDVSTLLASGNVVFEFAKKDSRKIALQIESLLEAKYKRCIHVIVRPIHDLAMLAKANPYRDVKVGKNTRLFVTFLDKAPTAHLKSPSKSLKVTKTCPFALCWTLEATPAHGTVDVMTTLEKHYGKDITTRNWNTVKKILALSPKK